MPVVVRPIRADEHRRYLEIHRAAVRGIAATDYPADVIDDWAPLPIRDADVEWIRLNPEDEIRVMAELDGEVVGMGALVVADAELRACYVAPQATRRGVGTAIVREIERLARENGLRELHLVGSVTAEPLYAALGYEVERRGEHTWPSGRSMAAVYMRKALERVP